MGEISKKNGEIGQHLPYGAMDEQGRMKEEMSCSGLRRKKRWLF
jgi:hypothetical protein